MLDTEVMTDKGWMQQEVGHRGWTQRLDAEVGQQRLDRGWTEA